MAIDEIRQQCWNEAINAYGTAYIFEQRYSDARKKLRRLSFFGVIVPVSIGGIVVSFFAVESTKPYLSGLIVLAGILGTIQLGFTLWSLIARWDNKADYSSESSADNYKYSALYSELAKNPPQNFEEEYRILKASSDARNTNDNKQEITETEKRRGMRSGLRKYGRQCAGCNKVPTDLNSTNCSVCGNF